MKRIFITTCVIVVAMTAFTVSSCQKDDMVTSDTKVLKSDSVKEVDATEKSSDTPPSDLEGPHNLKRIYRDPIGNSLMRSNNFKIITMIREGEKLTISVEMDDSKYAKPPADLGKVDYFVEIWDFALEEEVSLYTTWHKRHAATIKINEDLKGYAEVNYKDFFASQGIGERQRWFYLARNYLGLYVHKTMTVDYYSEDTKDFNSLVMKIEYGDDDEDEDGRSTIGTKIQSSIGK